jgi:hypothetical protein
MFVPSGGVNQPVDLARTEFNLFLRYVTSSISLLLTFIIAESATETITLERRKETWNSLLATPMTARAILQAALLATVWRIRQPIAILGFLWTMGLLAGAIHPLGSLLAMLNLAAWVWFFAVWGVRASVRARDQAGATGHSFHLAFLTLLFLALPFLLPARFNSVLLGAGSHLFVGWVSLVSYRDVRAALHRAVYPPLEWMGIGTGEGPLWALATCFLGIVASAVGGWWAWRSAIAHFDRLVGRPWRAAMAADPALRLKFESTPKPGSPRAEPGGAAWALGGRAPTDDCDVRRSSPTPPGPGPEVSSVSLPCTGAFGSERSAGSRVNRRA